MRIGFMIKSFIWPGQLAVGSSAPSLSLTSQDGAWIRSEDFINRWNVLLLFLRDPEEREQLEWVQLFNAVELPETKIFVVTARDTKSMRDFRDQHNLYLDFLYDPLSFEARRFGMSRRRFISNTGLVLIDTQQKIVRSTTEMDHPNTIYPLLGKEAPSERLESEVTSEEALDMMKTGYILIDVRTRSEYEAHHSPDALHIPIEDLSSQIAALPQKNRLIFICQAGERAVAAAELLRSLGSEDVCVVAGGMTDWNGPQQHGVSFS